MADKVFENGAGDVVGDVAHNDHGPVPKCMPEVKLEEILPDDLDVLKIADGVAEYLRQPLVDLNCDYARGDACKLTRHRSQSCADLEDLVGRVAF